MKNSANVWFSTHTKTSNSGWGTLWQSEGKVCTGPWLDSQNLPKVYFLSTCFQLERMGERRIEAKEQEQMKLNKEEILSKLKHPQEKWQLGVCIKGSKAAGTVALHHCHTLVSGRSQCFTRVRSFSTIHLLFLYHATVTQPRKNGQKRCFTGIYINKNVPAN